MRKKKFEAIRNLADQLSKAGQTMTFEQLRQWLNTNGYTSEWGNPYHSARGVARLVSCVWGYIANELGLGEEAAMAVQGAFTDQHGEYPWA